MTHFLIKWFLRLLPDRVRLKILVMAAMECALVRSGNHLNFELTVERDGTWKYKDNTPVETHNNLNHCNAAGCDGTQCDPDNNHKKGDF